MPWLYFGQKQNSRWELDQRQIRVSYARKPKLFFLILVSQYAKLAISLRVPGGGGKKKKAAAPQGGAGGAPAPAEEEDDYEGGLC